MTQPTSRFSAVTRRAFLAGIPIAALVPIAACSSAGTTTTSSTSTSASSSATSAKASTTSSGAALPSGASVEVAWTVTVTASGGGGGGGMTKNPYMAVWVEDAAGQFVATLALYHKQSGDRWLNSLLTWYASSGGAEENSMATVAAGSFTAKWDGTAASGSKVSQGDYKICVETAVEHGNESLVQKSVSLGSKAVSEDLGTDNDLSKVSVTYTV